MKEDRKTIRRYQAIFESQRAAAANSLYKEPRLLASWLWM
jgi:hypothetical protein